jgi:hypothetical protein
MVNEVTGFLIENFGATEKQAKAISKVYSSLDQIRTIQSLDVKELNAKLMSCTMEIRDLTDETEAMPAYVAAKETVKELSSALKETIDPLKATATLCVVMRKFHKVKGNQ